MKTFKSDISNKEFPLSEKISGKVVRRSIFNYILKEHPGFTTDNHLSISELNYFRSKYISENLIHESKNLSELEKTVLRTLENHGSISEEIENESKNAKLTLGQRVADKVATFGGSWTFIISFIVFLFSWIILNVFWLMNKGFDPYPFILLILILSCVAALQAPVIMMSQNRQEEKDRERAKNDYMTNLKSELEIRMLHEKLDHLMMHQQQDLIEIQKDQIDMLMDIQRLLEKHVSNHKSTTENDTE